MEQPQTSNTPTLESDLDQLVQELHQLASRVKQTDQHPPCGETPGGVGQYLVAAGRS